MLVEQELNRLGLATHEVLEATTLAGSLEVLVNGEGLAEAGDRAQLRVVVPETLVLLETHSTRYYIYLTTYSTKRNTNFKLYFTECLLKT